MCKSVSRVPRQSFLCFLVEMVVAPRGSRGGQSGVPSTLSLLRCLKVAPCLMTAVYLVALLIANHNGGEGDGVPDVPRAVGDGIRGHDSGDGPTETEQGVRPGSIDSPSAVFPADAAALPIEPRPSWKSKNCAVLSLASASGLEDHVRFVGSLRATGYIGAIILGISPDAPTEVTEYLDSQAVTYHRIERAASCTYNGTEGAEPMYMTYDENGIGSAQRIIIDADGTGWNCPKDYPDYKITWARFFYYRDWISGCEGCTDGIMLTDFRDAYFQADPFLTAVKMGLQHPLLVFEEQPGVDNTHWLTHLPVMSCRKHTVGATPVLCSGSTMGSREGIVEYLNVMVKEFTYWMTDPNCRLQGVGDDQSIHNYLHYTGQFKDAKAVPHRTGPIHVVGYQASKINEIATKKATGKGLSYLPNDFYVKYVWQKWLPEEYGLLDPNTGMIVNIDGLPSAQVHQYDRFGNLINGWLNKMKEKGWPYNNATWQ